MENSRFSSVCTKSIFNKVFAAIASPKYDTDRIQTSQVIHLNVNNSVQQVQPRQTTNSVTDPNPSLRSLSTEIVEIESEDVFTRLQNQLAAVTKLHGVTKTLLNEKEKSVNELQQIVMNQRKTILDLQLDNESISQKLQNEIEKRQETSESMTNLWALVEALKNYSDILKQRFGKFEDLQTEMTDFSDFYVKEVDELKNKFAHINLVHEESCNQFRNELAAEYQHRQATEDRFLRENERHNGEVSKLKLEIDKKIKHIEDLNQDIAGLNEKMDEKIKENVDLETETNMKLVEMSRAMEELKAQNDILSRQNDDKLEEMQRCQVKNQMDLEEVNAKLQNEKECVLSLEKRLKDNEDNLSDNEVRFSELENHVTEMETRLEESNVRISTLLSEQSSLESEIIALKENRSDMESVMLKLKDSIDEKQRSLEANKLELNESRANFAYAQEAKHDLETQVKSLIEENENLKKTSSYFENLWTGIKFDMKLQEQKLTTTLNNFDDKIKKLKEENTKLQKEMEAKESEMQNQKLIDFKVLNDLRSLTKKKEDENKVLKERNFRHVDEIEKLKKNLDLNKKKKPMAKLKNANTQNKIRTRSATVNKNLMPQATSITRTFTPTEDTDDSDLMSQKSQLVHGSQTVRKRVTFSPVITSHFVSADSKFDTVAATPPPEKKKCFSELPEVNPSLKKDETCYGTPRRKTTRDRTEFKVPTPTKPAIESCVDDQIDTDDVFKFSSD